MHAITWEQDSQNLRQPSNRLGLYSCRTQNDAVAVFRLNLCTWKPTGKTLVALGSYFRLLAISPNSLPFKLFLRFPNTLPFLSQKTGFIFTLYTHANNSAAGQLSVTFPTFVNASFDDEYSRSCRAPFVGVGRRAMFGVQSPQLEQMPAQKMF